jgi:AraC-like DNA-binding protein
MDYCELPAAPPLDSIVRCFWFLRGDDLGADAQVIVPDGRLEIILHLAEPFARLDEHDVARSQPRAILSGQLTAPIRVRPMGVTDIVGIRFRSAAAAAVLRVPLPEINDSVDRLDGFAPSLATALFDAANAHRDAVGRADALSRVLSSVVRLEPDALVAAALRDMDAPAAPAVATIADAYGVSARTFERRVLSATGLSPATLRRVFRFRRAFRMLDGAEPGSWSRIAVRAGYYDQAHLIRDFRQFAGATPTHLLNTDADLARAILGGE